MSEGETVIRYELGRIGCTVERIDEILLDVKRTAARDGVPRIEQCVDCHVFVSDWVEADESPTGRICRPCDTLRSLRRKIRESAPKPGASSMPMPSPAANWHPFIPPFSYDDQAQFIQDAENRLLLDIRGWGFLTGQGSGGLGLNDVAALAVQDEIGRRITALLNGSDLSLLIGLLQLTDREDSKGNWRVIIDYDNYQDGARILDGDGNILGECYDLEKKPNEKFLAAVIEAVAPNLAFARHLQACQQCGGPDDGCEEGQRLEQAMLLARAALDAKRKTEAR
jgi:hypothetical protein